MAIFEVISGRFRSLEVIFTFFLLDPKNTCKIKHFCFSCYPCISKDKNVNPPPLHQSVQVYHPLYCTKTRCSQISYHFETTEVRKILSISRVSSGIYLPHRKERLKKYPFLRKLRPFEQGRRSSLFFQKIAPNFDFRANFLQNYESHINVLGGILTVR